MATELRDVSNDARLEDAVKCMAKTVNENPLLRRRERITAEVFISRAMLNVMSNYGPDVPARLPHQD